MPVTRITITTTQLELSAALDALGDPPVVGVDVERADTNRYWRTPALIQVGVGGEVVLVDPLALGDLATLDAFLRARTVVLHAMDNDVEPLRSVHVRPTVIEDTAIAAMLLGLPTGLETLLEELLAISFDGNKARMQRADWSVRPLPDDMVTYAAYDVADLPTLWAGLAARLSETGRRSWYEQERDTVRDMPPLEERRSWTRLRGLGRLDRRGQTRARALWLAREALARDTDTAPNRVVSDRTLLDLASEPIDDAADLRRRGMRRQAVRRFGPHLIAALHDGQRASLVPVRGRRLDERERATVDLLRAQRSQIAVAAGLDPGVLCPNRELERAVGSRPGTRHELRSALDLRPWQWELMADAFADALELDAVGTPTGHDEQDAMMADVLNPDTLHHELDRLDGWQGTSKDGITKQYVFDDFAGSIAFVNRVAEHAEQVGHHPDLSISWDTVTVTYVTHSAEGVTQADIDQARAIDGLPR